VAVADADNDNLTRQERYAAVGFLAWLETQDYADIRFREGLRSWAAIHRPSFMWAIVIGQIGDRSGYRDFWCYPTIDAACAALRAWEAEYEPPGWTRHLPTGRYRPGGDPARERVER
jgi:hypothetical protein